MYEFIKRVVQTLGFCVASSAIIGTLVFFGIIEDTTSQCGKIVAIATIVFFVVNIYFLGQSYFLFGNIKLYYAVNFAVSLVFIVINAIAYFWGSRELYGFLFGITRVFKIWIFCGSEKISLRLSAMIFHLLLIGVIWFVPALCRYFIETEEETENVNTRVKHKIFMPLLGMRIAEIFLSEIAVSILVAGICELFAVDGVKPEALLMFIGFILLAIYNARCFAAYMDFVRSFRVYFRVNITAMLIFTAVCMCVAVFDIDIIMKVFFFPYRMFTLAGKTDPLSVLCSSGIMFAVMIASPFVIPERER